MDAALLTLTSLVVAGLFGFLWYLLTRQSARMDRLDARMDGLDARLRDIESALAHLEERFTRVEDKLDTLDGSIGKVLDKLQDMDTRLALLEGGTHA